MEEEMNNKNVLIKIVISLFVVINTPPLKAMEEKQTPLDTIGTIASSLTETLYEESGYDSGDEYQQHKKAHNRFFRRNSKNPQVREIMENFKKQYQQGNKPAPIILDGLSSRSKILLVRELTSLMLEKINEEAYWKTEKGKLTSQFNLTFHLNDMRFVVRNSYSEAQPGDLYLVGFSKYEEIQKNIQQAPNPSSVIAKTFINARKNKTTIIDTQKKSHPFYNNLNFLLDLEVARRLQDDNSQNDYDHVPVGSAIANFLNMSANNVMAIDEFFKTTEVNKVYSPTKRKTFEFPYGPYNVFQGGANHREQAVKNIIRKQKESSGILRKSKCDDVHKDYLNIFHGSDESSGECYSDEESN